MIIITVCLEINFGGISCYTETSKLIYIASRLNRFLSDGCFRTDTSFYY